MLALGLKPQMIRTLDFEISTEITFRTARPVDYIGRTPLRCMPMMQQRERKRHGHYFVRLASRLDCASLASETEL